MSDLLNIGKLSIPKITVGRENVSEISLGRIKLWPNDITEIWDYEGVMTVGYENIGIDQVVYGYSDSPPAIGDIDPKEKIFLCMYWEDAIVIGVADNIESIEKVYINGITYEGTFFRQSASIFMMYAEANPFPPAGQTCEIKLKYALAGPQPEEVTIGTQTWKGKNLDVDDGGGGIYAYNNDESNVATYGRLYTWDAAVRVAASIDGWHLPTNDEWTTLTTYLGGESVAGGELKETGFTALGGSRNIDGTFTNIGGIGFWWSATEYDATRAWYRIMYSNNSDVARYHYYKEVGYSVRLVKD
jgi:uncharacterized protein (TIGR02145 family)